MTKYILSMDEYQKTTEFFFRKELKWMIGFLYFFTGLIIIALTWACYFEIDIVVKARGIIRPTQTISNIVNPYDGRLSEVNYFNGKRVKQGEVLYSIDTFTYEVNLNKNLDLISRKKIELLNLKDFQRSVMSNNLSFSKVGNKYYYQYLKYQYEKQRLSSILREAQLEYSKNKELGYEYISEMELEKLKRAYEEALYDYQMQKVKLLSEIEEKINNLDEEIIYLKREAEDLRKKIALGRIEAPISGFVQCEKVMNPGDYIPSGISLFNIIPENSKLKVEIQVLNKDISKVELNQNIKYRIDSLSYKEYGVSTGKVNKVSADISPKGTYLVEGTISKLSLRNKSGNIENLIVGMESDIRIVTKRKKVLRVILEKLNFMNE